MRKIVIVGAGIGGLSAAFNLANNYEVVIYEARKRFALGHDWCDTMDIRAFDYAGFCRPASDWFTPHRVPCYYNPKETVKVVLTRSPNNNIGYIDQKKLIHFLLDEVEKKGVKIIFNASVKEALIEDNFVSGIIVNREGITEKVQADLVIDSAGMHSNIRRTLPKEAGIQAEVEKHNTLVTYRAYFDNADGNTTEPRLNMFLFHCNKPGISWVITEDKHIDILISKIGSLSEKEIEEALTDFRQKYPGIGRRLLRGGTKAIIPLRKTLPMIVYNGYAAVGDSAVMIEPLTGSGISLSLKAGKILADTVNQMKGSFDIVSLWQYQYKYFKALGEKELVNDVMKDMLFSVSSDDINYLFEKKILNENGISRRSDSKYSLADGISKLYFLSMRPTLFMQVLKALIRILNLKKICRQMPERYMISEIEAWIKQYDAG